MKSKCEYCSNGDEPAIIDSDGVLYSISKKPGTLQHTIEEYFWPCANSIKNDDEYKLWINELERIIDDTEIDTDIGKECWLECVKMIIREYEIRKINASASTK